MGFNIVENNICSICGENHNLDNCTYLSITCHVLDKRVSPKAQLTLPDFLSYQKLADGTNTIKTKQLIKQGTQFGPLGASKSLTLIPSIEFVLKVFPTNDDFGEYYLDTSNENDCTWLIYVQPAKYFNEQNLICFQEEEHIFYLATRDIPIDEELKVWYSPHYAKKMQKTLLSHCENMDFEPVPYNDGIESVKLNWTCKFCKENIDNLILFANHLMNHYILQTKRKCNFCDEHFTKKMSLEKHVMKVHNIHNFSLNDTVMLNNDKVLETKTPLDSSVLDNMNTLGSFDMDSNFCDDTLEESDFFNENQYFDITNENEFTCDICQSNFLKLSYLITHLRRHIKNVPCNICKQVFHRKEDEENHACYKLLRFKCQECNKEFRHKKTLNEHLKFHREEFKCQKCGHNFSRKTILRDHTCGDETKYICNICGKEFDNKNYLRKHWARHEKQKDENYDESCMCSLCPMEFSSKKTLQRHIQTHENPQYKCEICDKSFHRKDSLISHSHSHNKEKSFGCSTCDKKFKTEKAAIVHEECHQTSEKFKCNMCGVQLTNEKLLKQHIARHEKNPMTTKSHECQYCPKSFQLRSSLTRHVRQVHSEHKDEYFKNGKTGASSTKAVNIANDKSSDMEIEKFSTNSSNSELKSNLDIINELSMTDLEKYDQVEPKKINIINNVVLQPAKKFASSTQTINIQKDNSTNIYSNSSAFNNDEQIGAEFKSLMNTNLNNAVFIFTKSNENQTYLSMPDLTETDSTMNGGNPIFKHMQQGNPNNMVYIVKQNPKK